MRSIGGKLADFLGGYHRRPFDWATNNCAHFVHEWYVFACQRECIGFLPPFAGYKETRLWFEDIGQSFGDVISTRSRMQQIGTAFASVGDIVLVDMYRGAMQSMAIYSGPESFAIDLSGKPVGAILPISLAWRLPNESIS